jgi:hypothetical protein
VRVYELRASHVDLHRRRQLQSDYLLHNSIVIYVMDAAGSSPQRLRMSYKAIYGQPVIESTMITDMITGIIGLLKDTVQDCGAAIADRVGAPHGKYNNPRRF